MSSFNPIEKLIARTLSSSPTLKNKVKLIYQKIMYLKHKKNYSYKSEFEIGFVGNTECESFFGYYDKCPQNDVGLVLVNETKYDTRQLPNHTVPIDVCVYDINNEIIFKVKSYSYNWQQGCRSVWINSDMFICNDFNQETRAFVARQYSLSSGGLVNEFDKPIQDSFEDKYFLSLNYQRLATLRPDYGYTNKGLLDDSSIKSLDEDGVFYVDMKSGKSKLLISLSEAATFNSDFDSRSDHKINHVMISPSGHHFIFMHRSINSNGERSDRLLLADINGNLLKILSNNKMVSHCHWLDDNTVLGFLRGPNNVDTYWKIDTRTGQISELGNTGIASYGDGHPTIVDGFLVTDTYPDKSRMQRLMFSDLDTDSFLLLGEFYHSFEFSHETRCDLHPRLSLDKKKVFFDSVYTGKRRLCYINLDKKVTE